MKTAFDFRSAAREALQGRWGVAVIAGLIASLLGAAASNGPKVEFQYNDNGAAVSLMIADQQIYSSAEGFLPEWNALIVGGAVFMLVTAIVIAVGMFLLSSIISLGYTKFNLDLVDRRKEPELNSLFGYFPHWKHAAVASLLQTVYTALWSLLFVIPGIMAGYSYAMTSYILAENPEMAPSEAIERSKQMMDGNRWRLFCLHFSFIGWELLCPFTLGVGYLWLKPYMRAASAAFYRDLKPAPPRYLDGEVA